MNLMSEFKELYYKEIEHSDRLNNRISTALTLLTILGAGEVLLLKELFPFSPSLQNNIFCFFCSLSFVSFGITVYMFAKAYSGYKYNYFPVGTMNDKINEINEIVKKSDQDINSDLIDQYIERMFKERFIEDAVNNRAQNIIKSKGHRRLNLLTIITFFLVMISFIILTVSENEAVIYYIKFLN